MARSRNIKPGFFTNEDLVEIDPLGRLLFIGLWTIADREGRLEDRPKKIKMEILPCDNCDVDDLLECLQEAGFISRYIINGKKYIQIINFKKHQNPHIKEAASTIPANDKMLASVVVEEKEPDKHDACTGQDTTKADTSHADSSLPITDSLNPHTDSSLPHTETSLRDENTLSGKPDGVAGFVRKVVDHLNTRTGSAYKATSQKTKTLVRARRHEGFTLDDFICVIDKKTEEWLGTDMQAYLRPETLFGTKFESYLNQKVARKRPGREPPENPQLEMARRAIEMLGGMDNDAGSEDY